MGRVGIGEEAVPEIPQWLKGSEGELGILSDAVGVQGSGFRVQGLGFRV